MAGPRAHHPSKEAWEEKKAVIREMYLRKNCTCAQVQEYLEQHHFHVNTRQIKNKLSEWEFERKKTRAEQYLAMLYVADSFAAEGYDVIFNVPKRDGREDYTTRKIRKECDRIRKKRDGDGTLSDPRTLEEAENILSEADIRWRRTSGPDIARRFRQPISVSQESSPQTTNLDVTGTTASNYTCSQAHSNSDTAATDLATCLPVDSADHQARLASCGLGPRQRSSHRQHKLNANRWIEPYYKRCFEGPVSKAAFERHRRRAMQVLESILKQDNQYIFPALAEIVMIFGSNQRTSELTEFLSDSCTVIDSCPGLRGSFTYDAPFRYALAFSENNLDRMREYGAHLTRSMVEVRQIWGEDHPNFLVNANFCAWHAMHNRDYHIAIPLLRRCLPICERVMGPSSLVTINCLVITSRAHAEIRNHVWARNCLEIAMTRLDDQRQDLKQFRLVMLHRLGELNLETGEYQTTEMQFWKVLQDRTEICGMDAGATWSTAQSLYELFCATGREDHAEELMDYMRSRLDWERDRPWYVETGEKDKPPPETPWWWPYGAEEEWGPDRLSGFSHSRNNLT
ncbi:hypothetical protein A1O1_03658 [Capronia coronata CBS 617.96]|uniref:Clr5 domain-containing protein n=1 Tax=Capronia coronata CBS 617.96 TaxID=1182541 RepID=W9YLK1_9EURO|nr:uncharacterized protein A1O1_03658 [Capronia coronata CBS 617.96]EXJ90555.1 hypothetical protein A1O1_03658 [Capronia coronata CBS 617.96]